MPVDFGEPLSEREHEIVVLVAEGLTNREIAARLFVSPNTVKVHMRNVFTKTGVSSRTELSMLAVQEGWIQVSVPPSVDEAAFEASPALVATAALPAQEPEMIPPEPPAPWTLLRWLVVALATTVVLVIWLLPELRLSQTAELGPGDVFGFSAQSAGISTISGAGEWRELSPLPVRRAGMGVAALAGKIYTIGGMTENGPTDRTDAYLIDGDSWESVAPRPVALANVGAAVIGERIYVPGGCDTDWHASDAMHSFDVTSETWTEADPLPGPLCAYAVTAYGDRVYLFGGWDGKAYQALGYVYDPAADTWAAISAPRVARGFGAAAMLSDRILYVGGYDGRRELDTCEIYIPVEDRWEDCGHLRQPRGGLGLAAIGGKVYAVGGGWDSYLGFNEFYSPASNQWTVMETPIVGEWRNLGLVAWETSVYAVGGWDSDDFLNLTYAAEVLPWRIFIPGAYNSGP